MLLYEKYLKDSCKGLLSQLSHFLNSNLIMLNNIMLGFEELSGFPEFIQLLLKIKIKTDKNIKDISVGIDNLYLDNNQHKVLLKLSKEQKIIIFKTIPLLDEKTELNIIFNIQKKQFQNLTDQLIDFYEDFFNEAAKKHFQLCYADQEIF